MLRTDGRATIAEITIGLGWQPHTSRGVISGMLRKKLGLTTALEKTDVRRQTYKIIATWKHARDAS